MTFRLSGRVLWSRKTLEDSFCGRRAVPFTEGRPADPRRLQGVAFAHLPVSHPPPSAQKPTETWGGAWSASQGWGVGGAYQPRGPALKTGQRRDRHGHRPQPHEDGGSTVPFTTESLAPGTGRSRKSL